MNLTPKENGPSSFILAHYETRIVAVVFNLAQIAGYDSIGDFQQVGQLVEYLDELDKRESLPKMVLYNLNPSDNYAIAAALRQLSG